ncbi:MAG: aspartate kinase [Flavobacteriales bacterium]|jgi:aspartate kinase
MVRIFKFGGASVKDAGAVRNMTSIVQRFSGDRLVIVLSAMGKTTNALENVNRLRFDGSSYAEPLAEIRAYHEHIIDELFGSNPAGRSILEKHLCDLDAVLAKPCTDQFDREYDQIIVFGELISTAIIDAWFQHCSIDSQWFDARNIIATDSRYRDARVDWERSAGQLAEIHAALNSGQRCVLQGFIGKDSFGNSTSLGREGSDFTASIMAYLLNAADVTIWKDVPGMLNADPKWFKNTVKLDAISFKEAIELAYYGASVIHPKTIKPLQNKGIPLYIKSFLDPEAAGTIIQESTANDGQVPSYIFKSNQVLLSIATRDFSFVVEDNLKEIFDAIATAGVRIHLMENSAISFSVVFDYDDYKLKQLTEALKSKYSVRYNEPLTLITIRHWDDATVETLTQGREILLEQRSRHTLRILTRS